VDDGHGGSALRFAPAPAGDLWVARTYDMEARVAVTLKGEAAISDSQALACAQFALETGTTDQELARWVVFVQGRLAALDRLKLDEQPLTALRAFVSSQHANRDHPITADAIRTVLDAQKDIFG
jgi:hypothetical protein